MHESTAPLSALDQLLNSLAHAMECPFGAVMLMNGADTHPVAVHGDKALSLNAFDMTHVAAAATSQGGMLVINDAWIDDRFIRQPIRESAAQALPRFVLVHTFQDENGNVVGLVCLGDALPHAGVTPAQHYVVQSIAAAIGRHLATLETGQGNTALATARSTLVERLRLLESVVIHAKDSILITEAEPISLPGPRIVYCNAAFTKTTGYTEEEVLGKTPRILQSPKTDRTALKRLPEAMMKWQPIEIELLNVHKDGTEFWVELSIVPVADESGWFTHWVSVQRDISERKMAERNARRAMLAEAEKRALEVQLEERKRIEADLTYIATHDDLTGLRNRAFFMDRLRVVVDSVRGGRANVPFVFFMDLDRFKLVNDSLGHRAGDVLLINVAARLKGTLRPEDTLARMGGDEFVVLVESVATQQDATALAERIISSLKTPHQISGHDVFTDVSVGIVQVASHYATAEEVVRDADIAMYEAKGNPRSRFQHFSGGMRESAVHALRLQTDLQQALQRNEFTLHYQFIHDTSTGRLHSVEALIRWQHPQMGFVSPAQFIPIAESIGLIQEIGWWVLRTAMEQMAAWDAEAPMRVPRLNVNVSAVELLAEGFVARLASALRASRLDPTRLQLEITEGVFLQDSLQTEQVLSQIRALGLHVALDDFGTGYSSLAYLDKYPVDSIKIDRSFIVRMLTHKRTLAIVESIIRLGESLGIDIVAEGVETAEQLDRLSTLRCRLIQGYLMSRPMPPAQAATFLMEYRQSAFTK